MKGVGAVLVLMLLNACGPNNEDLAQQCGVSASDVMRTKSAVKAMRPYAGAELGKCSVIKDDSGVEVIPPNAKRNAELMVTQEAMLNGIADECGLPRSTFRLVDKNELQLMPPADAKYEGVDCALTELRKNKLVSNLRLGFVGNEYVPENRQ